MKVAYVDTSFLLALAFDEPGADKRRKQFRQYDRLFSSNLLEAELRASFARHGIVQEKATLLKWITWVWPSRPLTLEFERALSAGLLKGADLWHVACALYLEPEGKGLAFITLDQRQREVAVRLGFESQYS